MGANCKSYENGTAKNDPTKSAPKHYQNGLSSAFEKHIKTSKPGRKPGCGTCCKITVVILLAPWVIFGLCVVIYYDFWSKFYDSLTGEAEVGGLSLLALGNKFLQFFVSDPDDPATHEELWEKDRHLCYRDTTLDVANPELFCYYKNDRPFLRLAPLKIEVLHRRPVVKYFHGVVNKATANILIHLAYPHLFNATAFNPLTGEQQRSSYRHSQHGFIWHYNNPIVYDLFKKVELYTNLNSDTADAMQVAKYDLGGHYSPHYDFYDPHLAFLRSNYWLMERGNNVATTLIYLSETPHNSGTIFPRLNLTVNPSFGDAIFWFNIKPDGTKNRLMWHAGCEMKHPKQQKWISNVWFRERGQEFTRPCGLTKDYME